MEEHRHSAIEGSDVLQMTASCDGHAKGKEREAGLSDELLFISQAFSGKFLAITSFRYTW
jgi:hypothetical protein